MTDETPETPETPKPADPATVIRQAAAARLSAQLDLATALLTQCGTDKPVRADSLASVARLMQASAGVTRALTLAALGETRHRSISEAPSPVDRKREARIQYNRDALQKAEARERFSKRLDELVEQSVRARMGEAGVRDTIGENRQYEEQVVANLKRLLAEDE